MKAEEVLFVGRSKGVISWYRTGSPAFAMGCDWVGINFDPPEMQVATAVSRSGMNLPDFDNYKVIILQQVSGRNWFHEIIRLKNKGIKVFYEIDDYIHGVGKIKWHMAKDHYTKKKIEEHELCMKVCTGMIVSTPWLARQYKKFNKNIYVCENAIEKRRYEYLNLPARKTFNIGWAGGEGHWETVKSWLPSVTEILDEYENSRFISIGLEVANEIDRPSQAHALPVVNIENYPGAMCNFDISIGPAGRGGFYAAKSDLRYLETGALGIPLVGDPFVYGRIIDRETGIRAENPQECYDGIKFLIDNPDVREEISYNVRDYVLTERAMETRGAEQWEKIFIDVAGGKI